MPPFLENFTESFDLWFSKIQFGTAVRMKIYQKLGTYVMAGMPIGEAIHQIYIHTSDDGKKANHPIAKVLRIWQHHIANGEPLVDAIDGWVPESEQAILCSGDATDLPSAIDDLMKIQDAKSKILGAIKGGLTYPLILVLAGCGFLIMFSVRIVPQFSEVLPRNKWGTWPAAMADIGDFFTHYLAAFFIAAIALTVLISWTMPRWTGPVRKRFDNYPPWSLYRVYAGSSFMLVLSAMLSAGMTSGEILDVMMRHGSPWLKERLGSAQKFVADGYNIGDALYKTQLEFPDKETVRDLRSYAGQPDFSDILKKVGDRWLADSVVAVQKQSLILKYVGMGFATFVICGFISAIGALEIQVSSMASSGQL